MKRSSLFIPILFSVLFLSACEDPLALALKQWQKDKIDSAVDLENFELGYWKESSGGFLNLSKDWLFMGMKDEDQLQDDRFGGLGQQLGVDLGEDVRYNVIEYDSKSSPQSDAVMEANGFLTYAQRFKNGLNGYWFEPKLYPENANVLNYTIKEYGDNLLFRRWKNDRGREFEHIMSPVGVGYTGFEVTVNGNKSITKRYPIKVQATVDMLLFVNRFWRKNINLGVTHVTLPGSPDVKLRFKVTGLPDCLDDMLLEFEDSVKIFARCSYETCVIDGDVLADSNMVFVEKRDTISLPMEKFLFRFKQNRSITFRDLTDEISSIMDRTEEAYEEWSWMPLPIYMSIPMNIIMNIPPAHHFVKTPDGKIKDLMKVKHHWYVENVVLYLNIYCDNPFVAFNLTPKKDGAGEAPIDLLDYFNEHGGTELSEEYMVLYGDGTDNESGSSRIYVVKKSDTGDIVCEGDADDFEDLPGDALSELPGDTLKEVDPSTPFVMKLNDFMTQAQRDSVAASINQLKKDSGYTSNISDKAKDDKVAEMNKKIKENK